MDRKTSSRRLFIVVISAVLIAIGILIPMIFPKVYIPPMSFTLASHVAIFIGVFISPLVAVVVAIGTALGFVLSGLPLDVWLRAASHVVFALVGALWIRSHPATLKSLARTLILGAALSVIHALGEFLVIIPLYFSNLMKESVYESGFVRGVVGLVAGGTFVHSMIDFAIAWVVWRGVERAGGRLFRKD